VLRDAAHACSAPIRSRCASAYRAGPGLDDALAACRRLAERGLASTIGYSAARDDAPRTVADAHAEAFDRLEGETTDCYVSVKLSALGLAPELFVELESAAARSGRRLHLDAVAPEAAGPTWRLLENGAGGAALGTTLPGRWSRSIEDALRAVELRLPVRVVKGQWPDPLDGRLDPSAGFLAVVDRLVGHPAGVAVATHEVPLLVEALRRLTAAGTACEVELFYGLPFRGPALAARAAGVPVRLYVPYGHAGTPYRSGDLAAHPTRARWLVEDLLLGEDKTWRSIRRLPQQ
jgi:proline dehydrogenase